MASGGLRVDRERRVPFWLTPGLAGQRHKIVRYARHLHGVLAGSLPTWNSGDNSIRGRAAGHKRRADATYAFFGSHGDGPGGRTRGFGRAKLHYDPS